MVLSADRPPRTSRGGEQELMQSTRHTFIWTNASMGAGVLRRPLLLAR
jgi:hypothetical protein